VPLLLPIEIKASPDVPNCLLCLDKINQSPRQTHRFRPPTTIMTTQQAPYNTFSFFIKADGWHTSTEYCHVFGLFLLIFLGCVGVVVSRRSASW